MSVGLPSDFSGAWLVMDPSTVPGRWRDRARTAAVVHLLPAEASALLAGDPVVPALAADEEALAHALVAGRPLRVLSRDLGLSPRTVQYRIARLRDRMGATSTADLVALLAANGFEPLQQQADRLRRDGP